MSDVKLNHPDMRERKQITVKMTKEFAQDLNLLFASYGLTDLSYVVRESVAAQAEYVRRRMASVTYVTDPSENFSGETPDPGNETP